MQGLKKGEDSDVQTHVHGKFKQRYEIAVSFTITANVHASTPLQYTMLGQPYCLHCYLLAMCIMCGVEI